MLLQELHEYEVSLNPCSPTQSRFSLKYPNISISSSCQRGWVSKSCVWCVLPPLCVCVQIIPKRWSWDGKQFKRSFEDWVRLNKLSHTRMWSSEANSLLGSLILQRIKRKKALNRGSSTGGRNIDCNIHEDYFWCGKVLISVIEIKMFVLKRKALCVPTRGVTAVHIEREGIGGLLRHLKAEANQTSVAT